MVTTPCRSATPDDMPRVSEMMFSLTGEHYDFSDEIVFVAEQPVGVLAGFLSLSLRPWAEGCDSTPVPYIEGWWVEPDARRRGLGNALMHTAMDWCRNHGYTELASDVELGNGPSMDAHRELGFEPTVALQLFRRRL
jgi:aminoglycoside 6'-N-acetyltransferase I